MSTNAADLPTPGLSLRTHTQGDATVVQCSGRLTAGVTEVFHTEVKRLMPNAKRIVLDLTDVTHMDSSGLGTVAGLYFSAKAAGCNLELINLSKRIRELLSITNLLSLFEAYGEHSIRMP